MTSSPKKTASGEAGEAGGRERALRPARLLRLPTAPPN